MKTSNVWLYYNLTIMRWNSFNTLLFFAVCDAIPKQCDKSAVQFHWNAREILIIAFSSHYLQRQFHWNVWEWQLIKYILLHFFRITYNGNSTGMWLNDNELHIIAFLSYYLQRLQRTKVILKLQIFTYVHTYTYYICIQVFPSWPLSATAWLTPCFLIL